MFTLGIDFGTNSVRALVVRCRDGAEFGSAVFCLALARILFARQAGGQSALAWIGLVASLLCMVLSFSRSALACAGLGGLWLGLVWLMRSRRGTARLPGVKVAVMMIALVLAVLASVVLLRHDQSSAATISTSVPFATNSSYAAINSTGPTRPITRTWRRSRRFLRSSTRQL